MTQNSNVPNIIIKEEPARNDKLNVWYVMIHYPKTISGKLDLQRSRDNGCGVLSITLNWFARTFSETMLIKRIVIGDRFASSILLR